MVQEYSSQWILAAGCGTAACVRACGFGPSWDIWRNAGITESPLARRPRPHSLSGFPRTTWKPSVSAKCGLFRWNALWLSSSLAVLESSAVNQSEAAFFFPLCVLSPKCHSQSKPDHKSAQKCQSNENLNYKDSCYCKWSKTITIGWAATASRWWCWCYRIAQSNCGWSREKSIKLDLISDNPRTAFTGKRLDGT